jgi:hypothetical protein
MPRKRKAPTETQIVQIVAAVNSTSAVSSIVAALNDLTPAPSTSLSWQRKLGHDELYSIANKLTPYGTVCQETAVQGKTGPLLIYHVNPFALWQLASDSSQCFLAFLAGMMSSTANGSLDIVIYLDKATPGNQKRPDVARSTQCLYWTCLQFPPWFRSRRNGWIPFAYIYAGDQQEVDFTDSMLVRFMVRTFDSSSAELAFSKGFNLQGQDGTVLRVQGLCRLSIADWDQHVKTFNLKGFNGSIPCGICKNVLGRCAPFEDDYLVHVLSSQYEKFDRHTPDSFAALADRVRNVAEHTPAMLRLEEQATGIKWDPHGLLWDEEVRTKMAPPLCEYPDWMHTYVASGGMAQYELNGLIIELHSNGVQTEDIDAWIAGVKIPKGMTKLKKTFFHDRTVFRVGSHIRAFASEVLTAIVLLGFFLDAVVKPGVGASLSPYLDCFDLLRIILSIFQQGRLIDIPTLGAAMQTHHVLFVQLYPESAKPKVHQQVHILDFWLYWKELLSCFGPERHHRLMKRVMGFSYRGAHKTALAYDVRIWIKNLGRGDLFMPMHLAGTIRAWDYGVFWQGCGQVTFSKRAASLNCEFGMLSKNDLVQYREHGVVRVAFVAGFAATIAPHVWYVAVVWPCEALSPTIWRRQCTSLSIVRASAIVGSVPYIENDGLVAPLLHGS